MMFMDRASQKMPEIWQDNWEKWTKSYLSNLDKNSKHKLNMQNSEPKKKAYKELVDTLLIITKQHCAFCDNFPLGNRNIKPTVEHFKPKSKGNFPDLAYKWDNLFPCCSYCQEKGDNFDDKILKPDLIDYDFYNYFEFNDKTWEITPASRADVSFEDKQRAETTLKIYKLNGNESDRGKPLHDVRYERQRIMNKYLETENPNIEDFPFRFMF